MGSIRATIRVEGIGAVIITLLFWGFLIMVRV